jgi:hypothetical protein
MDCTDNKYVLNTTLEQQDLSLGFVNENILQPD